MAVALRTDKYALVDYHDWTPRSEQPANPSDWRNAPHVPEQRSPYGGDDGGWPSDSWSAPVTGTGDTRGSYGERDYTNGYWSGEQRQTTRDTTLDPWPSNIPVTGNWRMTDIVPASSGAGAVALPAGPQLGSFDDNRDYPAVIWWTVIWYAGPILLYTLLALVISSSSMRGHALHALISDALGAALALVISLGIATGIRRITLGWRAITAGFGGAVIGAAIATLILNLI